MSAEAAREAEGYLFRVGRLERVVDVRVQPWDAGGPAGGPVGPAIGIEPVEEGGEGGGGGNRGGGGTILNGVSS